MEKRFIKDIENDATSTLLEVENFNSKNVLKYIVVPKTPQDPIRRINLQEESAKNWFLLLAKRKFGKFET